ncbi:hypothetical protein JKY79_02695 [Candidatus Babeliales bacterium]|nr:hypothetical protein [Candidatus Babeliales bacterium]
MNKKQILKVLSLLLLIALSSSYGAADLTKNIPTFRGNLLKVGTKVDQIDKIIESSCKNYKNSFHAKDLFRPYHSINEFITQIKQKPSEFKVSEPGQKVRLALAGFLAFFSCYGSYRFLPYIIFDPVTEDDLHT